MTEPTTRPFPPGAAPCRSRGLRRHRGLQGRASCCAGSPSPATTSPSYRPRPRCEFVGAPTWAALSGKPVATDVWTDVHEVPHVRIGQSADLVVVAPGDRRPARQGRARPGRRPAHQHPAHRPLPGRVRAGDAHRDVGAPRDPGQRRDAARARRPGHRAGRGPADRRRHRQGPAARARRDLRGLPRRAGPRRRRASTWPAATWSSRPAAPASTSTRSASSATAPRACRATRWPARPPPAAPR